MNVTANTKNVKRRRIEGYEYGVDRSGNLVRFERAKVGDTLMVKEQLGWEDGCREYYRGTVTLTSEPECRWHGTPQNTSLWFLTGEWSDEK